MAPSAGRKPLAFVVEQREPLTVFMNGETLGNYKRTHFMECLDLPSRVDASIELAIFHDRRAQ